MAWAYAQYGVPSFSTSLWTRPELNKEGNKEQKTEDKSDANTENNELTTSSVGDISQETLDELLQAAEAAGFPVTEEMMEGITPEDIEMYAKMSGVQIKRVKEKDAGNKSNSEDVAWLVYSDEQRDRNGFIEWSTFDHPQLGTVEIGGWVPYFKTLPPTDEIDSITEKQVGFINDIANRLPKIQLSTPTVTKLGNNIWEIKVAVVNNGWFPTGTAMAKKNKRARPLVVRLDVPNDTIVSGQKVNRIWSLQGSGTRQWYKWILKGKPEKKVTITLFSEKFGSKTISVSLKNTDGGDA